MSNQYSPCQCFNVGMTVFWTNTEDRGSTPGPGSLCLSAVKNKEKLDILPSVSFYRKTGAYSYLHKFCPVAAAWLCVYPQVPFSMVFCNFLIQNAKQSPRSLGKFTGIGVHTATVGPAEKRKEPLGFPAHQVRPARPQQQSRFLEEQLRV